MRWPVPALLLLLISSPLAAQGSVEDARALFLNLAGRQHIDGLSVEAPPPGVQADWAARVTWEQAPGRPHWGHVGIPLRADTPDGFSFDLLVESVKGTCGLNVYLSEADGDRWVATWSLSEKAGAGWTHVSLRGEQLRLWQFGNGVREPETIGSLVLGPYGKESAATFHLANLAVHTRSGSRGILSLMAETDCPPPTAAPAPIRLPARPRCYAGMSFNFFAKEQGQGFVAELHKCIPNLGVAATASSWRPEWREVVERWRRAGVDVRVQNGGVQGMAALITRAKAWGVDPKGRSRNAEPGFGSGIHGVSLCHPTTREAVRRVMAGMRGLGVLDFEQIDYIWPWMGGPWGYGEWDLAAFRTDLQGLDEGLRLADGRLFHFWEYLAEYGTPKLRPSNAGLGTWDTFHPTALEGAPKEQAARRHFLFIALTHYEWLKFAQAMGSEARTWGGGFLATMNPEDVSNGGDYLFWNRLADTGPAYFERFGSPAGTEEWRHAIPYLKDAAASSRKRLGVICEVGVGGHGRPYLDPEVAYCMSYDHTASGRFDDMQNEWMDEADWASSQEGGHRDRLLQWLATARGFNQAKADSASMPRPKALAIGLRCVLHAVGHTPSYLLTRGALNDLNTDCDYADLALPPEGWERYQVLVYTPWESSRRHLEALPRWLDARPGRVLVTHGAVPSRVASGLGFMPSAELGDGTLGGLLGLGTLKVGGPASGKVTAVHPSAKGLFQVGEEVNLPGRLFSSPGGEALVRLGAAALVTQVRRKNGSRVVYLNYAAGQPETRALDARILGWVFRGAGCHPMAVDGNAVYCHTYTAGPGKVAVLWSRDACERFKFEYRGDIEQRMPYRDAAVDLSFGITGAPENCRVYDFLSGQEEVRKAPGGVLPFALKGRSCALVYFGPDTPAWRALLERVRQAPRPDSL